MRTRKPRTPTVGCEPARCRSHSGAARGVRFVRAQRPSRLGRCAGPRRERGPAAAQPFVRWRGAAGGAPSSGPIVRDMGGYSYTPVEFKPLGPPPEAKPDLALETEEAMVRIMRDILIQRGALDVEATPQEANGASPQVPAYKFADAAVGRPWQLSPDE